MSKDSHADKGYGRPSEVPPDRPAMLGEILKPTYRDIREQVPDETDDDEHTEGRNWAILLTLFSFLLGQLAGVAMIIWAVFW
ncbi:hypothetical protein RJJ65_18080 [Rhizobium hidalgonense]|uniref:Uncharacterized protein n=1 Tax=Rhizobium hidalgonense TaxID=1538159 RepID=A0A2A6K3N3_9HYPH|nr:hypothetical protein [Rhizobium hidalgonense]MDR9774538.1 hypothetical protein [Rhizobium hidalgonense]MDR9809474.1 hypothetical protein [Rhizobium hidalgonense]MDR9820984.1 hypothetical protein [Rhizobium hidalgonense]PDT19424.1 hypothetical protein CO674_32995 [Rhizobium hidalgonense]PON05005.1 hypothetical protein ATY29_23875 [Rhizobium hidalgonense]